MSYKVHSITVYVWLVPLLKDLEKYFRNFICGGDVSKMNMVMVV